MANRGREVGLRAFLDPELQKMAEQERLNAKVAQMIYDARTGAKLTQKQLAERVGTTQSVIARLEDSDYAGHSLTMQREWLWLRICTCKLDVPPNEAAARAEARSRPPDLRPGRLLGF